jgi:hypothetical protein
LLANLSCTFPPPGWDAPAVPRNTGDATAGSALLPAQLLPYPANTWFNWSVFQNPAVSGTWHDELYLDEDLIQMVTRSNANFGSNWWLAINTGPMVVPGGRHSVEIYTDRLWEAHEDYDFRSDNQCTTQFLWQPPPLAPGSSIVTTPPQGEGGLANCNAFAFTRTPGTAWVASIGANEADVTFPLVVYDDYANSTTGLTHVIGSSARALPRTNFVVGSADGAPATVYPAVHRPIGAAARPVAIAVSDASGRRTPYGVGAWTSVSMPAGVSAQVFEAYLTPGLGVIETLTRIMGTSDLELLAFQPNIAAASAEDAQWVSIPRDGDDEYDDLAFPVPTTGWYLFVVARVDGQHIGEAVAYTLQLDDTSIVGTPVEIAAAPLAAAPSPAAGPMRLSFALARPEHVRLEVFDLAGRAVRRLADEALPAGPTARVWDGTDDRGAAVAPGHYWARLTAGTRVENLGVLRIR